MRGMDDKRQYVSRGGEKLAAGLDAFGLDVTGCVCADFGANVGGFTDCLLKRGAAKVYAVDTGYGELAWKLRKDERVVVMERTNALHAEPPEAVDIVTIDVAWTTQAFAVPAARRWLKDGGKIISLLKPHYEYKKLHGRKPPARLELQEAQQICERVCGDLARAGHAVTNTTQSPLHGKGGNAEFLILITNTNSRPARLRMAGGDARDTRDKK